MIRKAALQSLLLPLLFAGTTWCVKSLRLDATRIEGRLRLVLDGRQPNSSHVVSLLCFMVVRPRTPEVDLVRLHLKHRMLAGCNRFFVFSNESLSLNESLQQVSGAFQPVIPGSMEGGLEGWPPDKPTVYSVKNTHVFLHAWWKLFASGAYRDYDWTVKVDPDTVLFPDRLRLLLKDRDAGKAIATFDSGHICKTGMGGLAVLSRRAVESLHTNVVAFSTMPVEREDGLLVACVRTFGGTVVGEPNLVLNPVTNCATAEWKAAYHPQKWLSIMELCYMQTSLRVPPPQELLHTTCL